MSLPDLFFSFKGRIGRTSFFLALIFLWTLYFNMLFLFESAPSYVIIVLAALLLWTVLSVTLKRLHDIGKGIAWLLLMLLPIAGPVLLFLFLLMKKGMAGMNTYGASPAEGTVGYVTVRSAEETVINDITQINPVVVKQVVAPVTTEEIVSIIRSSPDPISIGGGRFSMGGQVSSAGSIHVDMRRYSQILELNVAAKTIRVQTGVRWCDIQRAIDPHDLSVKIMQTYANFTVGGSLSVNSHGRYVGQGPLILSVRSIRIVLADGEIKTASRDVNPEIFFGAIGGYGSLGVIIEAELDLADNVRVERHEKKLRSNEYLDYFTKVIRGDAKAVFHNADIYPPAYKTLRAVTWMKTHAPVTTAYRLMPPQKSYAIHRYFYWAFSETMTGKWRREFIIEPLLYRANKVHWRNYEAGYDVAELEPWSRKVKTYVLQEYFVPTRHFDTFVTAMSEILRSHSVNMINISVRHALADPGTYLAWAKEESFAFVLYHKQRTDEPAREHVGNWTRALIEAALKCEGTYYLPYQPHATVAQFHRAYPRASELFALKKKLDPDFRFRNVLWNKYYKPEFEPSQK